MMTLDAVRTAVLSDKPWMRLDELVRAELAAGRRTKQIYDELVSMADAIDATPGLSEGGSDAFGDTLDALTGMCHRDCRYEDPPNTALPTEDEIAKLPRWARVAFAARCARRVLALYGRYTWPSPRKDQTHLLELAVAGSELGMEREKVEALLNALDLIHTATLQTARESHSPALYAMQVVRSAAAALQIRTAGDATHPSEHARFTFEAAHAAKSASDEIGITPVIRRDFDHLAALAEWQHWTDDTPVPPEVFGPLWPEGPPKGWPPIADAPPRAELALELFARDRATEQVIEDDVVNLFNALNRYHIARGGVRLTLEQFRSLLPALVPAGV